VFKRWKEKWERELAEREFADFWPNEYELFCNDLKGPGTMTIFWRVESAFLPLNWSYA